ncbi:MAG: type II toxin-antitoxin system VapC family toxin [Solirubrobacteraceae bacterium]
MTDLLLDTHVALWWLAGDARLTTRLRDLVVSANAARVSSASTWEVAIKIAIGKLELTLDAGMSFPSVCAQQGFRLTAIEHEDAWAVVDLAPSRADPFDRLIAATARRRGWTVVSADPVFTELGVPVIGP